MRHEQIKVKDSYGKVDVAAVWPSTGQVAPLPIPDIEPSAAQEVFRAAPAAPDVPAGVGILIAGSYAALVAAFAFATVASSHSIFMIVISALFVVTFFTVPRIFLGTEPKSGRRPTLERFLSQGMETLTGHSSGRDALVQMLIVPVSLTLGVIVMGIAAAFIL